MKKGDKQNLEDIRYSEETLRHLPNPSFGQQSCNKLNAEGDWLLNIIHSKTMNPT